MITNFPNGLAVYGQPILPMSTTGKVFFVGNSTTLAGVDGAISGSNGNSGATAGEPFSTLAKAYTMMAAGRGDVVVVLPGHAETITTTLTPAAGSATIGLGWGAARPLFTSSGAIDLVTVSANNVFLRNIRLTGATSATSLIEISGNDPLFEDVEFLHTAAPLDAVTVSAGGLRSIFRRCKWIGQAAGPDTCITVEAADVFRDCLIEDCLANYHRSSGLDEGFIQGGAFATAQGLQVRNLMVLGIDTMVFDFLSSAAIYEGMAVNVYGAATTGRTLTEAGVFNGGGVQKTWLCVVSDATGTRGRMIPVTTGT